MNTPVLIVACITALAVVAHVTGGTKETATLSPDPTDRRRMVSWVQAMCAFQMLSVDLLAVTALLFAVAVADLGPIETQITLVLSLLYFLWGVVWVAQVVVLKRSSVSLLRLPHWTVWFLCSGLLFIGA